MRNIFKIGLVVAFSGFLAANLLLENKKIIEDEIVEFEVAVQKASNDTSANDTKFVKYDPKAKDYSFECKTPVSKTLGFNSPKKEWDVERKEFIIDNNSDTVIRYETGSIISIPKNSFENTKGEAVEGHITVKYREFHNAMEVAISGIPMNLGDTAKLISGGMFEIRAQKEGGELLLKQGSGLNVQLATSEKGEEFDYYYLNNQTTKWELKGDLKVDTSDVIRDIANQIRWWQFTEDYINKTGFFTNRKRLVTLSIRPHNLKAFHKWGKRQKGSSEATFFTVFSKKVFPHNKNFKYLNWELLPNNDASSVQEFLILHENKNEGSHSVWENLSFSNCDDGTFYMHLSKGSSDLVLKVKPTSSRYPGDKRFKKNQVSLEDRITIKSNNDINDLFEEAVLSIRHELSGANMREVERFLRLNAIYDNEIEDLITNRRFKLPNPKIPFLSEFNINNMGVHNCDNALARQQSKKWKKSLMEGYPVIDDSKSLKEVDRIVLVHKGVNSVVSFTHDEAKSKFFFSKLEKSLGLVFLANGKVKLIFPKQFKRQKKGIALFRFESVEVASQHEMVELANELGFDF